MRRMTFALTGALVATMAIAGCGGGASPGGSPAPSGAPAASNAAPSAAASGAASAAPSSGGGQGGGDVCGLVAANELAKIFGVASVTTTTIAGPPDSCIVNGPDGKGMVSWVLTPTGGRAIYDALALPGQSSAVPGLGDAAAFVENTGLLVAKGDRLLSITIAGAANLEEVAAQDASKKIATIAVAKM